MYRLGYDMTQDLIYFSLEALLSFIVLYLYKNNHSTYMS